MTVWVVTYRDEIAAIYTTEEAATAHVEAQPGCDAMEWAVLDEYQP